MGGDIYTATVRDKKILLGSMTLSTANVTDCFLREYDFQSTQLLGIMNSDTQLYAIATDGQVEVRQLNS